jgi:benzoyl-CoA reductase subunit A
MEQLRRSLAALTDSGQASAVRELLARSIEWLRCRWLHQEVPPYMLPFRTWQELRRRVLGELPSRAAAAADERATVASLVESLLSGLAVPAGDSERFADLFDLAVVDEYGSSWPLRRAVQEMLRTELVPCRTVVTGYGRRQFDSLGGEVCSEINCHARSACEQYPGTRMVLDIGGQDTKVIAVCDGGRVQKFWMNDRCAAGCGRYVAYVSEELGLSYEQLDELALGASRAVELSTTCTVFAGVELRERLALGGSPAELAAGLFSAVAKRALSLVGRAGGLRGELTFTGGMAAYRAAVRAVRQAVKERYGEWEVNVPADPIMAGALGAAGIARDRWLARERRAAS